MNPQSAETVSISDTALPGKGLHWVALAAASFTWILLISGGEVTTYKVGMAVPDWPSTFGENMFLYDFWNASIGVFKEHLHRLLGATLGFAVIILAMWAVRVDPRLWMKAVAVGAFLAVSLQGLLGGSRVTRNSQILAAVHACSGQAVFALLVAIAVWTSPRWWNAVPQVDDDMHLRRTSLITLALVYLQVLLGAWVRHFPSPISATVHVLTAIGVFGSVFLLIRGVKRNRSLLPALLPAARAMTAILAIQIILGVVALWILLPFDGGTNPVSPLQALIRTGHQANGALLLASAVVLTLRAFGALQTNMSCHDQPTKAIGKGSGLEAMV